MESIEINRESCETPSSDDSSSSGGFSSIVESTRDALYDNLNK